MSAETSASVRPISGDLAGLELGGDPVGGGAGGAERLDLGVVLDGPDRADDVVGRASVAPGEAGQQIDQEAGPRAVADGDRSRPRRPDRRRGRWGRSVSSHGWRRNTSGRSTTRGASSRGTTSMASPSTGSTSIVSRSSGMAS